MKTVKNKSLKLNQMKSKDQININYTKDGVEWEVCVLDINTGECHVGHGKTKSLAKKNLVKWFKNYKTERIEQIRYLSYEIECCLNIEDKLF